MKPSRRLAVTWFLIGATVLVLVAYGWVNARDRLTGLSDLSTGFAAVVAGWLARRYLRVGAANL